VGAEGEKVFGGGSTQSEQATTNKQKGRREKNDKTKSRKFLGSWTGTKTPGTEKPHEAKDLCLILQEKGTRIIKKKK